MSVSVNENQLVLLGNVLLGIDPFAGIAEYGERIMAHAVNQGKLSTKGRVTQLGYVALKNSLSLPPEASKYDVDKALAAQREHAGVIVAKPATEGTCPNCGTHGDAEELFGFRRMRQVSKAGAVTIVHRIQSQCRSCRNAAAARSRAKNEEGVAEATAEAS